MDPVIQQPLAYRYVGSDPYDHEAAPKTLILLRVDRKKSVEVLEGFLNQRENLIEAEVRWLKANNVNCVLSDAVFIAWSVELVLALPFWS